MVKISETCAHYTTVHAAIATRAAGATCIGYGVDHGCEQQTMAHSCINALRVQTAIEGVARPGLAPPITDLGAFDI